MGVAAQIGQDLARAAEGRLGIDDPFDLTRLGEEASERGRLGEMGECAKEAERAGVEGDLQVFEEQTSVKPREHAHGQEEASPAGDPTCSIQRKPAAGHDTVDVWMMMQVRPQVWSTARRPTWAPKCLGSAAIVRRVSAAALKRMP